MARTADDSAIRMKALVLKGNVNGLKTLTDTIGTFQRAEEDCQLADEIDKAVENLVAANISFQLATGNNPHRRTTRTFGHPIEELTSR